MIDFVWIELTPREGMHQPVEPGTIGREGCDIVVPDPEMSRRHAAVRELDGGIAIEDLGSKNGTFVNDRRIDGIAELKHGDRVRFGNTTWVLEAAPTRVSPPRPEASKAP